MKTARYWTLAVGAVFLFGLHARMEPIAADPAESNATSSGFQRPELPDPGLNARGSEDRPSEVTTNNLVSNGGFEYRTKGKPNPYIETLRAGESFLSDWEIIGDTIDWIGPTHWKASEGSHCLDLDAPGGIRCQIRTQPGVHYLLSFDMAANVETTHALRRLKVLIDDDLYAFEFDPKGCTSSALGWATHSVPFTATTALTTITFSNPEEGPNASGVALDNVAVHSTSAKGRFAISAWREELLLLDSQTGDTWRLAPEGDSKVWIPVKRR